MATDNSGFVVAAYVVTALILSFYTWRVNRRLRQARNAAGGHPTES